MSRFIRLNPPTFDLFNLMLGINNVGLGRSKGPRRGERWRTLWATYEFVLYVVASCSTDFFTCSLSSDLSTFLDRRYWHQALSWKDQRLEDSI